MANNVDNIKAFDELLRSTERTGIDDLIHYLHKDTDFYLAPASTIYHSSYEGGLLQHSLNVYKLLSIKLRSDPWLQCGISQESAIITGLLHDVCKINLYVKGKRNVRTGDNRWEQVPSYYNNGDPFPIGHGEKSVIILQNYIKLSQEEALAIRWHMGMSEPKELYKMMNQAMEQYPLVTALMEADYEATNLIESPTGNIRSI